MKYECNRRVIGLSCAKCIVILGQSSPPEVTLILHKQGIVTLQYERHVGHKELVKEHVG